MYILFVYFQVSSDGTCDAAGWAHPTVQESAVQTEGSLYISDWLIII